jgi:hypothetical protein
VSLEIPSISGQTLALYGKNRSFGVGRASDASVPGHGRAWPCTASAPSYASGMRIMGWTAAAVLLVACSSGSTGNNGSGTDAGTTAGGVCGTAVSANACIDGCNPCTRISDAQVAAVVGASAAGQWDGDACLWDFYDAQGELSFEVELGVNYNYATYEDLCHPADVAGDPYTVTPVSGVGDDGCYLTTSIGALGSELDFLKGCWAYAININGPVGQSPPFSDAVVQADERALALDAVSNL